MNPAGRSSNALRSEYGHYRRVFATALIASALNAFAPNAFAADQRLDADDAKIAVACPGYADTLAARVQQFEQSPEPTRFTEPGLRHQLSAMFMADQDSRKAATRSGPDTDSAESRAAWNKVSVIDRANLPRLKRIIHRYSFPTVAMVGHAGTQAMFLLIQHADDDPAFQARMLELFEPHLKTGDVFADQVALLTDRVLVAQDKPQRYGTQFSGREGVSRPSKTEQPDQLDERRSHMGLGTMALYACVMKSVYGSDFQPEPWPDIHPEH